MLTIEALGQTSLFAGIARQSVAELWSLGQPVRCLAGEKLFDRGSQARDLLIVESGLVDLFFPVPILGAVKELVVEQVGPGEVVAWSALVPPYALTLSARCVESGALRRLARSALREHLDGRPAVGYQLMRNLAGVIGRRLYGFQNLWIREVQASIGGPVE